MAALRILSPRPRREEAKHDPGPGLESLAGAVVGVRTDDIWPEWDVVSNEWARMLEADGAQVRRWQAGSRTGDEAAATAAALDRFVQEVDLVVVGLGN